VRRGLAGLALAGLMLAGQAGAQTSAPAEARVTVPYQSITSSMAGRTVTLTGHDLTIDDLVAIARYGAKVKIGETLRDGAAASYGLLLQAQAEGVPVYLFNRRPGSGREDASLTGEPGSPSYEAEIARRYAKRPPSALPFGFGPDIAEEEVGRAMLAVDLNNMRYLAASPAFVDGIAALLNAGVTPAVYWRGAIGEADFVPTGQTLQGHGFAYYKGRRMQAADALRAAGLKPVQLSGGDGALVTTSALTAGFAALLVHDLHQTLQWHDLIWAMDLAAMNGSIGPITMPVQSVRPFAWPNYAARRELEMLRGSYVFNDEPRIIQDPESLRATVWRVGSLWESWAKLRDTVLVQLNSTDHNPTVRPGIAPEDSWELATPQMMKYHVKGGRFSNGVGGYVLSNSNWDPHPLVDTVEQVTIPLASLMVAVVERIHRFEDDFFTGVDAKAFLAKHGGGTGAVNGGGGGAIADALWQELKPLANPVSPDGVTADRGVGDLDAVPMLKLMRLRQAMHVSQDILGQDMLNAAYWLDIRALEKPDRDFGTVVTPLWKQLREAVPFRQPSAGSQIGVARTGDAEPETKPMADMPGNLASRMIRDTAPTRFYADTGVTMPGGAPKIPRAEPTHAAR
jgi:histidine ammonia-lyase